jgi:hypothetical protein
LNLSVGTQTHSSHFLTATDATMNLDSYTRLNPFSDEEKSEETEISGRAILMAAGISSVVAFVVVMALGRNMS